MENARSTMPKSAILRIPGWRLIRSDQGRFWAFREKAFPRARCAPEPSPAWTPTPSTT